MDRSRRRGGVGVSIQDLPVEQPEEEEQSLEAELAAFAAQHLQKGSPGTSRHGSPKRQSPISLPGRRAFNTAPPSGMAAQLSMDLGISKPKFESPKKTFRFGHKDTWEWVASSEKPRKLHTKRAQTGSKRSNRRALGGSGIKPGSIYDGAAEGGGDDTDDNKPSAGPPQSVLSFEVSHEVPESVAESVVSQQERQRHETAKQLQQYTALLPGSEETADPREKAHLKRMLVSADGLAPVRYSFQKLGIDEVNRIVYEEEDPSRLIHTLSADIYTGIWSCCRKANVQAPGCRTGPHSDNLYLCVRCGAIFDPISRKQGPHECYYHPGALNRSKAGGVWWSCCGAIGFNNSLLHSEKGDIHGAQEWRWGCKKDTNHRPLSVMDANVDIRKFAHCTVGPVRYGSRVGIEEPQDMKLYTDQDWVEDDQDVTCMRMTGITVIAQPLLPVIIGIQLHFENVIDGEIADGDRRAGNPGLIAEFDHLRKVREEKFTLEYDEFLIRFEGSNSTRCITDLTVCTNKGRRHTFFQAWKEDNNEQSLYDLQQDYLKSFMVECEQHERVVGLQYGLGEALYSVGLLTQDRLAVDHAGSAALVRRCTLCASFFVIGSDNAKCKFHTGFWTPQRRVRLADSSSMPKCAATCEARSCGRKCNKYEHRTHVMVHSCGDSICAENCSMDGCPRRCAFSDHFHGTNDPMAVHSCGKAHPCRQLCVCGKQCKFVAARGEAVHTQHWCGATTGCQKTCDVVGCNQACIHPNHHHALEPDCFHLCKMPHPCEEKCSAKGCEGVCTGDRYGRHRHKCSNAAKLGCLCKCSMEGCTNMCCSDNHFHNDVETQHTCGQVHYCTKVCSAPGCKSTCSRSREEVHDRHECLNGHEVDCLAQCSVPGCRRRCVHKDHFHGLDLVKKVAVSGNRMEPRERHLCAGMHRCEYKCRVFGCVQACVLDKKDVGHDCYCGGTVGCRHRCYFAELGLCKNFCASSDHEHDASLHLCDDSHRCSEPCERTEPCLWDGPKRKRDRKICTKKIPSGKTMHEGSHDCCGKHARPIAYSYTEEPDRCMQRCEKRGCRRRCKDPAGDEEHELWADGLAVHVCEQVLCLDPCPFPACQRVCNLAHTHSVLEHESQCGCCPAHRAFINRVPSQPSSHHSSAPGDRDSQTGQGAARAGISSASRTLRKLHEIRASREVAMAKQRTRSIHTKRQQPRPGSASAFHGASHSEAQIRSTKTATMRENIAKGDFQHLLLAGFAPEEAWASGGQAASRVRDPSPDLRAAGSLRRGAARPFSAPPVKRSSLSTNTESDLS